MANEIKLAFNPMLVQPDVDFINADEKVTRENRRYWKLREILPGAFTKKYYISSDLNSTYCNNSMYSTLPEIETMRCSSNFTLQNNTWSVSLHHNTCNPPYLSIAIWNVDDDEAALEHLNASTGIIGESGEEIAVSRADACSARFQVINWIDGPQLDSILQSNEGVLFFVEIRKKDVEKKQEAEKRTEKREETNKTKNCK